MKIYISGALKVVSDRKKIYEFYEWLGSVCAECGHEPYLPHKKSDPAVHTQLSFSQVFEMDFKNLESSDKILAVIDEPSTGMGAEIAMAIQDGKDVICVYDVASQPSRFILGLLEKHGAKIISYENQDDCKKRICEHLNEKQIESFC